MNDKIIHDFEWELQTLVDGELPEDRRRKLLQHLEETPGAWRACALAFLEAYTLRSAISTFGSADEHPEKQLPAAKAPSHSWGNVFALAAAICLAFTIGVVSRSGWRLGGAKDMAGATAPVHDAVLGNKTGAQPQMDYVYLQLPNRNMSRPVMAPVFEGVDRSAVTEARVVPADQLVEQMQSRGYLVKRSREVVPVVLRDGRRAEFPCEDIELEWPVERMFQ